MKIDTMSFTRLLKLELPQLAKGVLQIVENHEPEVLLIESAFNDFELLRPAIESLIVSYGPHPITEQLAPLRKKRILYATAISFQVRGLAKGFIDGDDSEIAIARAAVNRYLHNLRLNNEEIINERVDQFLDELSTDSELVSAMDALGFMSYIDKLTLAHIDLKSLLAARNASISKRDKGVAPVSSKAIRDGLALLFMRITAAMHDNKELDYKPLISELNEKLIRYKGLIKARETALRSSRKSTSTLSIGENVTPTGDTPYMRVANVSVDDFDNSQNQKKTVAPSGKLMQLPPFNNEA